MGCGGQSLLEVGSSWCTTWGFRTCCLQPRIVAFFLAMTKYLTRSYSGWGFIHSLRGSSQPSRKGKAVAVGGGCGSGNLLTSGQVRRQNQDRKWDMAINHKSHPLRPTSSNEVPPPKSTTISQNSTTSPRQIIQICESEGHLHSTHKNGQGGTLRVTWTLGTSCNGILYSHFLKCLYVPTWKSDTVDDIRKMWNWMLSLIWFQWLWEGMAVGVCLFVASIEDQFSLPTWKV